MNDRSLLSVLLFANESATFPGRLSATLGSLLRRLGVAAEVVAFETAAMNEFVIAPTNDRSVLGCMRDAQLALAYAIESGRYSSLEELKWELTEHIHRPTGYRYPASSPWSFSGRLTLR